MVDTKAAKPKASPLAMKLLSKSLWHLVSGLFCVLNWFVGIEVCFLLHVCFLPSAETVVYLL